MRRLLIGSHLTDNQSPRLGPIHHEVIRVERRHLLDLHVGDLGPARPAAAPLEDLLHR